MNNHKPAPLAPEIAEAAEGLIGGAAATCERIDGMLNVVESRYTELRAKGEKLKELIQASAEKFAEEAKVFLASMHKLDLTLENESKRVNGESPTPTPMTGTTRDYRPGI
jgi:hypothetical protein